jgi:hypothetical protein
MNTHPAHTGQLSWLGYELPIAAPVPVWFEWLENFTGLDVTPMPVGRSNQPPVTPVLSVLDDRHVLVDGIDLRTFPSCDDLKAWLFLTVSDVMITRGGFTGFHAAGLVVEERAVLVSGQPWSGKSSWAFEAHSRGLGVLGDDQVCVDPPRGVVHGLPRPMKRRLLAADAIPQLSEQAVRARLDDEAVVLEPRRTAGLVPVDRGHPVSLVIHLSRHRGPGVEVASIDRFAALQAILTQVRGEPPAFLAATAAAATMLARVPNIRVSVGDGEIGRGLDSAVALATDHSGPFRRGTSVG